jgi:hypothetical protein
MIVSLFNFGDMKRVFFVLAVLVLLLSYGCVAEDTVYVCTGKGAFVWHCKRSCRGLKNCDGQIISASVSNLSSKYKRGCEICY